MLDMSLDSISIRILQHSLSMVSCRSERLRRKDCTSEGARFSREFEGSRIASPKQSNEKERAFPARSFFCFGFTKRSYATPITALISRNSSNPCGPHSRPLPDCLYPPNGACMSPAWPLIWTMPVRSFAATARACWVSTPKT